MHATRNPVPQHNIVPVAPEDAEQIAALTARLENGWRGNPAELLLPLQLAARSLPDQVDEALLGLVEFGSSSLLLRDLIVGPIGRTPETPWTSQTADALLSKEAALVLSSVGRPIGPGWERGGELVRTVVAAPGKRRRWTTVGNGTRAALSAGQCRHSADLSRISAWWCFRGDPKAVTMLLDARTLQEHLSTRAVRLLRENAFYTLNDPMFADCGAPGASVGPFPVLSGSERDPIIVYFHEDLVVGGTEQHSAALAELKDVFAEHHRCVVLRPGDLLVVDPARTISGTTEYCPQDDGGDRWLGYAEVEVAAVASAYPGARQSGRPMIDPDGI